MAKKMQIKSFKICIKDTIIMNETKWQNQQLHENEYDDGIEKKKKKKKKRNTLKTTHKWDKYVDKSMGKRIEQQ